MYKKANSYSLVGIWITCTKNRHVHCTCIYRIVGNFRGSTFSDEVKKRLRIKILKFRCGNRARCMHTHWLATPLDSAATPVDSANRACAFWVRPHDLAWLRSLHLES